MIVENSHTLYIIKHSILFLITIHTVTYHTNTQSLHLSCLCLLFHNTLRYLIVSFSILFLRVTRKGPAFITIIVIILILTQIGAHAIHFA